MHWCIVTRYSIRKLNVGTWLNDEIINFAILLFNQEQHEKYNGEPKCYCFNSYFIEKLLNEGKGGYKHANVNRWIRKIPGQDVFKFELIMLPIDIFTKDVHLKNLSLT